MNFNEQIDRRNTASLKWDATEERFGKKGILPLWVADMDFKAPQAVIDAIKKQVDQGVFGYSLVPQSTYDSIINWLETYHNWKTEKEWITFSPGVVPAISSLINAFTEPGDGIIIQSPVYYPFFHMVKKNDRALLNNQLMFTDGQYKIDFDHLEEIVQEHQNVKMFILSNPHNPVGRVWTREELIKLGDFCVKHDILMISDEIHSDLIFEGNTHIPLASISEEFANQTITCMAPSKTFNLAGLQTSYLVMPNKEHHRTYMSYYQSQGLSSPNSLGITALEAAYNEGRPWLDNLMEYITENLEFLISYIEENIPSLSVIRPEGTYLVWIDATKLGLHEKELEKKLVEEGEVAFNQGYTFGKGGEGFIRINLACPKATLEEALNRLKKAVNEND